MLELYISFYLLNAVSLTIVAPFYNNPVLRPNHNANITARSLVEILAHNI